MIKYLFTITLALSALACSPDKDQVASASDRQFIHTAFQRNLLDIQNSQIVRTRGSNEALKRFAQQVINQSSTTNEELLALSQERNLNIAVELEPTMQQEVSALVSVPLEEFDDKYLATILQSRKRAISLFELQIRDGKDNALRQWASGKISGLKKDVDNAERLSAEIR